MWLGETSPVTSYQPQGRSPETQIPKKSNFPSFPHLCFSPAGSLAGSKRNMLVGYSQETVTITSFLLNCTVVTHTNPSGSSTLVGNVLRGSASKLAAAEVTLCPVSRPSAACEHLQAAVLWPWTAPACHGQARPVPAAGMAPCPSPSILPMVTPAPTPCADPTSSTYQGWTRETHHARASQAEEEV